MSHDAGYRCGLETRLLLNSGYHGSRLTLDPRRDVLWRTLWNHYFSKLVPTDACVLDLGCGYGNFINNVVAGRRIAVDMWPDFPHFIDHAVETVVGDVRDLEFLENGSVDFAFASNVFEHVTQADFAAVLASLRRKLSANGELTILQPNYRYAYREYFDDYTHIAVYTHIGLSDFLAAHDFDVFHVAPKFMPLTVKSRMPVSPWLIRAYLASPVKPLGKQMLIRARPRR
ncbi:MAG TPA: class I SAM-dependent methyltransferase [Acetobacteraceae bacterium]|nr:class I SAM-dependent methyltransferase [Acetobacteraceae bacterium]